MFTFNTKQGKNAGTSQLSCKKHLMAKKVNDPVLLMFMILQPLKEKT